MFFCTAPLLFLTYVDRNGVVIDMDTGVGRHGGPSELSKVVDAPTNDPRAAALVCGAWAPPPCPPKEEGAYACDVVGGAAASEGATPCPCPASATPLFPLLPSR